MVKHPTVSSSFFVRFLLITSIVINFYLMLQSVFHTVNLHQLDLYVRWYGFKASPILNLILLAGTSISFWGALQIFKKGLSSIKIYLIGKLLTCLGFLVLMIVEYNNSSVQFPIILVPVLIGVEAIYPILIYISLRKSKVK